MSEKKFLVPTDFSSVADCALDHAIKTAEIIGASIVLMHALDGKHDREKVDATLRFQVDRVKASGISITSVVREGSIFTAIPAVAEEEKAELIFMGTHGMKGMQFIKGSYALKVVSNSKVPFIIVQDRPIKDRGYRNIVVPLDLSKETKQKLGVAASMAKYFNSKIHLFSPFESDQYLRNHLQRNLSYAKKFFHEKSVNYDTTIGKTRSPGFAKDLIRFAKEQDADLITILNVGESVLTGVIGGKEEVQVITNSKQIPVMMVNPKDASSFWFG